MPDFILTAEQVEAVAAVTAALRQVDRVIERDAGGFISSDSEVHVGFDDQYFATISRDGEFWAVAFEEETDD